MTLARPFKPDVPSVVFFSRGRGRGHAIPDMALIEEVRKLDQNFDLRWVSYGTGAATIRERGVDVIDLHLPDDNPFLEAQIRAARVLSLLRPKLVLAHEEFAAVPAAKIYGIPTVFITDWFGRPEHIWMQCLRYADDIVFIDEPDFFETPHYLLDKVHYVGTLVRDFAYSRHDRDRARRELGLRANATIISVLPGNWATEARAPIFDFVVTAFQSLELEEKILVWIAGQDYQLLTERATRCAGVIVKEVDWQIDRLMAASDLAITKANRKTCIELAKLGISQLSISYALNPMDDARVCRIPSNTHLRATEIDASILAGHIKRLLVTGPPEPLQLKGDGLRLAARRLAEHISSAGRTVDASINHTS